MGLTRRLVDCLLEKYDFDLLPSQVVNQSKDMMLNAAAVSLAAAAQPEGQAITEFIQEMQGNGTCTVIGRGMRTSPVFAALANGILVRLLDFDDEIIPLGSHPSCTVFPVVMALGEVHGYSGKSVIAAFALGCEVASKVAAFGKQSDAGAEGIHPKHSRINVLAGTIGSAVASALLLELDAPQFVHSLGLACGEEPATGANFVTSDTAFQSGRAAMNGVMATMLAQKGVEGNLSQLEGPGGFLSLAQGDTATGKDSFISLLANPYDISNPGVTLKLYPCATASHTTIDAVIQLVQQYRIPPTMVESVKISVTQATVESLPYPTPENSWQARSCLSYLAATALLHGHPLIDFFSEAAIHDRDVREMMDLISIEGTQLPGNLAPHPSEVTVLLKDGRRLRHRVEFARGQPELPLDPQDLDAKFLYCTRYILPPDHIQEAIDSFRDLENIPNITGMASVLGG